MTAIRRMLVTTDHTHRARVAEARAGVLCGELPIESIDLLTVRAGGSSITEKALNIANGWDALREGGRRQPSPACITRSVRCGDVAGEIGLRADEFDADVVLAAVTGSHVYGGFLLRCSSQELVQRLERPVLLVKRPPRGGYRSVLVAVDLDVQGIATARLALALAPNAHFIFLHVCDDRLHSIEVDGFETTVGVRASLRERAHEQLKQLLAGLGRTRCLTSRMVVHGPPAPTLAAYADQVGVDLVVAGKGSPTRAGTRPGRVASRLVDSLGCDILIVPVRSWNEPKAA